MNEAVWREVGAGVDAWAAAMWKASWQGGALVLLVWVACRLFRRLPAAYRCWLWWLACLRFALGLLAVPPLALALMPAPSARPAPPPTFPAASHSPLASAPRPQPGPAPSPSAVLLGCWVAAVLLQSVAAGRSFLLIRRLRQEAQPVPEGWLWEEGARLSRLAGLRRPLPILTSPAVRTPMLIGPFASALLLPAEAVERYPEGELGMALAHEIAHARRRDLWLSLLPGLVQFLFFFHPLARLASSEWVLAREAACDAEVLRLTGASPNTYGHLLLRLVGSGPVPSGALSATPTYRSLERRLHMLRDYTPTHRPLAASGILLLVLAGVGLLPWQVTAQAAQDPAPQVPAPVAPGGPRITGEVALTPKGKPRALAADPERKQKPPVITSVAIQGATRFTQDELRKVMKTRVGGLFDPKRWEADEVAISRLYQDGGYQARLSGQGPENGRLTLTLDELRVGNVQFKWLQPEVEGHAALIRDKLLQKPGALYSSKQLQDDFRTIRALELFETINPRVEVGKDDRVAVVWELGRKK